MPATISLLIPILIAISPALVFNSTARRTTTLSQLQHHSRILLIFPPESELKQPANQKDSRLQVQLRTMQAHTSEAAERDLLTVIATAPGTDSAAQSQSDPPAANFLTAADASAARRKFHVGQDEFLVLLIGKDGGEKLRSNEPLSFEKLQTTIDAMPMRQDEMKNKN